MTPEKSLVTMPADGTVVRPEPTVLEIIAAAARDTNVDVAKMSALLEMKERLDAKAAEMAYNQAMARLQPKLPRVKKRGVIEMGSKGSMPFAKWEDIDTVIRPILAAEGFVMSFTSKPVASGVLMVCTLAHIQGHSKDSEMQLPPDPGPGRNGLQAIGSSRSYAKRYLALDMLNIVTEGVDDDGAAAGYITDQQLDAIMSLLEKCGVNADPTIESNFLKFMSAKTPGDIQRRDFKKAITALESKLRAVAK